MAESLVVNGDFEAIDESGWEYRGENDGSRGVYSDPTRPGTHTYLLELAGGVESGVSAISQIVSVEPGDTYRLSFDLFDSCDRKTETGAQHFVNVGDDAAFIRDLGGEGGSGWVQRRILFQPRDAELKIEIGVRGRIISREDSTTAIDNVRLVRVEPIELAESLKRGRPFAPVLSREQLPIAIQMPQGGWGGIQAHRNSGAPNPAMASVEMHFDLGHEPFEDTSAALDPWIRQGITPILTANLRFDQMEPIIAGEHDAVLRAWADEAYEWGYPILFRPWAKMDAEESVDRKQFIQAWRRARAQFDDAGAANVLWIWSPTELTGDSEKFYPGDDSVDIVACSIEAAADLEAVGKAYAYHGSHYKNKALGFLDLEADETFLETLFSQTGVEYPRLEFVGLTNADPSINPTLRKWLDSDFIQPRLAQAEPPSLTGEITRKGRSVRIRIAFADNPLASRVSRARVEFWDGHPAAAGSSRVGKEQLTSLKRGDDRDLKQSWPRNATGKIHVRVDTGVDSAFLHAKDDPASVTIFTESGEAS